MNDNAVFEKLVPIVLTGFLVFGAVAAFFSTGLMPYANARDLYFMGGAAAAGASTTYIGANLAKGLSLRANIFLSIVPVATIAWAIWLLAGVEADAKAVSAANDVRCAAIQEDMLSAYPRMKDGPAVFEALHCDPNGTDTRIFVPPTDLERRAGHPLPNGGRIRRWGAA